MSSPAFSVLPERVVSGEIGAPTGNLFCPQPSDASANLDDCAIGRRNYSRCQRVVSSSVLTSITFPDTPTQRLEREENTRHGQTTQEFHHPARQAAVEIGGGRDGCDWFGVGSQRGGVAPARLDPTGDRPGTHRSLSDAAAIIRDQRRRDMIAAVEEWRRASGPDRVWWRRDARHRLAEWRRLHAGARARRVPGRRGEEPGVTTPLVPLARHIGAVFRP